MSSLALGSLARNTGWNLVGLVLPLLAAVIAIPLLDSQLGTERYGLLLIIWMFAGYFSLFDLGLSRALTHMIAEREGVASDAEVRSIASTGVTVAWISGALFGLLFAFFAEPLAGILSTRLSETLTLELQGSLLVMALLVPFATASAALRGILEAFHRFRTTNLIRVPLGLFTFLSPLLILPLTTSLVWIVGLLLGARIVSWAVLHVATNRIQPHMVRLRIDRAVLPALFKFGGWMTVSNVVSPVMVYMDRLLIGGLLAASAVAYYATPWEVVTKLLILPAALVTVLFPGFSALHTRDPGKSAVLYGRGVAAVSMVLLLFVVPISLGSHWGLSLWMGDTYADASSLVLQILAVGVLWNGIAHVPFSYVQGLGRADYTAWIHLVEFPVYILALYVGVTQFGIQGAAIAWAARTGLDCALLTWVAHRKLAPCREATDGLTVQVLVSVLALGTLAPLAPWLLGVFIAPAGALVGAWVWTRVLSTAEKGHVYALLRRNV